MSLKAVLIDLFDTLVFHDFAGLEAGWAARLDVDGETLREAIARTRPDRSVGANGGAVGDMQALAVAVGRSDDVDLAADLARMFEENQAAEVRLYPDSIPTLRALREAGMRTCLVSNCSASNQTVVELFDLRSEFDSIVLSFEIGTKKPEAAFFDIALRSVGGIQPEDAVFIDDQAYYCDGAADVGLATRLIARPGAAPSEGFSPNSRSHTVIRGLAELMATFP